jgi:membrane protein DedA with SNARE-associated domain
MPLWRFALFSGLGTVPWVMLLVWLGQALGTNWAAVKEMARPFEYAGYIVVAAAIGAFVYRHLRPRSARRR